MTRIRSHASVTAAAALALGALLSAGTAQAHQVWLEQDAQGARLYFGEFGDNLRETSPGLLDKFVKPTARAVDAKGAEREIALAKQSGAFHLAAKAARGESLIAQEASYPAFEKKEGDKVVSRSIWTPAARWVGDFQAQAPKLTLDVVPAGKAGEFAVFYKGQPLPDAKVEVVTPSGWARTVHAGKDGRISVALPWKGTYALEVHHTDKSGAERDGVKADTASFVTTLTLALDEGLAPLPAAPAATPNK